MDKTPLISHALLYESTVKDSPRVLSRLVQKAKVEDQLKPVTVIVPSRYSGLVLQRELGHLDKGLINVRFIQISELAHSISESDLMIQGIFPRKRSIERAVLRKLLLNANDPFRLFKEHPSLVDFLSRLFRRINLVSLKDLSRYKFGKSEKIHEIIDLYTKFQKTMDGKYFSPNDLYDKIHENIHKCPESKIDSLGRLIFYLPRNLSISQVKMIESLPVKFETEIILGFTGDATADTKQIEFAKEISSKFQSENQRIQGNIFNSHKSIFVASDPRLEAKWILSDILGKSENNSFKSFAIFYPKADPYQKIFHQEMQISGIPFVGPSSKKFADFAVGNALRCMLNIVVNDFDRKLVMDWLSNCPVSFPKLSKDTEYEHSMMNRVSKESGVLKGIHSWERRLNQFVQTESIKLVGLESNVDAIHDLTRNKRIEAAKFLKSSIKNFHNKSIPLKNVDNTWSEYAELTVNLLKEYLISEKELPGDELNALTTIFTKIHELGDLDRLDNVSADVTFLQFVNAIDDILSESISRIGLTGHGVFISDLRLGLGMQFNHVYFVGMNQKDFPAIEVPGNFFIDEIMLETFGDDLIVKESELEDYTDQFYLFKSLVNSAKLSCSFSYSKNGFDAQHTFYPSEWLLQYASELSGIRMFPTGFVKLLDDCSKTGWLKYVSSLEQVLLVEDRSRALDLFDYDLSLTMALTLKGIPIDEHQLIIDSHILPAVKMISARRSNVFSEWDGDVSKSSDLARIIEKIFSNPISATSLEEWAECPYKFFLHYLLGIKQKEDEPSEIIQISPQNLGSLIHQILEDFFKEVIKKEKLPDAAESWSQRHHEILYSIAHLNFSKAQDDLIAVDNVLWTKKREEILRGLENFLIEDDLLRREFGTRHILIEQGFGKPTHWNPEKSELWPSLEIHFADQKLVVQGKIDRIDFNDHEEALIIDYKTGRSGSFMSAFNKDGFGEGTKLQLPLYSLAANQANLNSKQSVKSFFAAYWFISESEGFRLLPKGWRDINQIDQNYFSKTSDVVNQIIRGIKSGVFPANPIAHDGTIFQEVHGFNQGNCRNCDFMELCQLDRSKVYKNRVIQDDRLKDYLLLKHLNEADIDE